jgi:hypothetical protein
VLAAGAVIGLLLSALFGRLHSKMLFRVGPLDPATFAFVTALLMLGAALSVAGPGLAGGPDRPGGGAAERVTAASGNGLCPEEPVCYALYRISWPLLWRCVGSRPQWAALPFVRAGDDASRHEA